VGTSRTLKVLHAAKLLAEFLCLFGSNRVKTLLGELSQGLGIVTKILLQTDKNCAGLRAVVTDLGEPLLLAVIKRGWCHDGVAEQEAIGLRIRKRSQTIVLLLTGSIPKTKVVALAFEHYVAAVVIEHSGDVLDGEGISGVTDEKACLTDSTITNSHDLERSDGRGVSGNEGLQAAQSARGSTGDGACTTSCSTGASASASTIIFW